MSADTKENGVERLLSRLSKGDHSLARSNDVGADISGASAANSFRHRLRRAKFPDVTAMLETERDFGRFFLFVPVFMALGSAWWFSADRQPALVMYIVSAVIGAIIAAVLQRRILVRQFFTLLAVFALGGLLADFETWRKDTMVLDDGVTATITGMVVDMERARAGRWRYTVEVISVVEPVLKRPPERVRLTALPPSEPVYPGAILTGRARISPPSGPAMPGGYDFAFSSYFGGLGAIGYFFGRPSVLEGGLASAPSEITAIFRRLQVNAALAVVDRLALHLSGDVLGFASAILVNDRRSLGENALSSLRDTGLAHVIAISGLHMSLAGGMFFWLFRSGFSLFPSFAQRFAVKKVAAIGALVAASGYLFVSGAPISAQRAFVMLSIMLLAIVFGKPAISLRNLAIAPSSVMSAGFQMSFGATAGLIAGYGIWREWRRTRAARTSNVFFGFAGGVLLTSLIGGISTALFSAYHFNSLPALGLFANLLAMPIFSLLVMPSALIAAVFWPFGLDWPFWWIMGKGLEAILWVASHVRETGGAYMTGQLAGWTLPIGALCLFFASAFKSSVRYLLGSAYIAILGAALVLEKPQLPEILVFEDGSLVAVRSSGQFAVNRRRLTAFVGDQWRKAFRAGEFITPSEAEREEPRGSANHLFPAARFHCVKRQWCSAVTEKGIRLVVLEDRLHVGEACDMADIIVSRWQHPYERCRSGALVIDRNMMRKRGSLIVARADSPTSDDNTVEIRGKAIALNGALDGIARAWTRHRYYDWRTGEFDAPFQRYLSDSGG